MRDRLFIGVYPTGISYCDRSREEHGDYAKLAFLPFRTLDLEVRPSCPDGLRAKIVRHAARILARRGEEYMISTCGQTVTLGHMTN